MCIDDFYVKIQFRRGNFKPKDVLVRVITCLFARETCIEIDTWRRD